jgi:hypothetical protein
MKIANPHYREDNDWQPANDLCTDIEDSYESKERLDLGISNDEVFIYYGTSEECETEKLASDNQPEKNLKDLIQKGAFLDVPLWWTRESQFHEVEKRALAATLVLSLALTSDTDPIVRCWDPESIYFLVGTDGRYISGPPYARCASPVSRDDSVAPFQPTTRKTDNEARFSLLARLLMEIECGLPLDHLEIGSYGQTKAGVDTLEDFIYDQIIKDLSESRRSYLGAVTTCYRFKRECQRLAVKGHPEDAAAQIVVYSIVKSIHKNFQHAHMPSKYSAPRHKYHALQKDEPLDWTVISSESEQLGLANDVAPSTRPGASATNEISSKLKTRTKRVKWEDEAPVVYHETIEEPISVDSPVATIDDTELFGDEETQESPKELYVPLRMLAQVVYRLTLHLRCNSAKKWVTAFKKLRKDKIGTNFPSKKNHLESRPSTVKLRSLARLWTV